VSKTRKIPGITVERRYQKWTYRIDAGKDPLTGERLRPYQGGYSTEGEAWEAAIEAKKRVQIGRSATAKKIRVGDFFDEWLAANEDQFKETTTQNYRDNIDSYIKPVIGSRWLADLTVPVLNAFYKHLREKGRRKGDTNQRMYQYWLAHRDERDGAGPLPREIAAASGTKLDAAREAVRRYKRGRTPAEYSPGLSVKSVRNIHVVVQLALKDAVMWDYLHSNPAPHAVIPRVRGKRAAKPKHEIWTPGQLGAFLRVALEDRYSGMWVLAAPTGMRRSELAGVERQLVDMDNGVLDIGDTRVVVGGKAQSSDGKSEAGRRGISLDTFTVVNLREYIDRINEEREAHGKSYPNTDYLMVGPEGRPLHPHTTPARFNRLVDKAGLPRIRLHDVRHTYATIAQDAGHNIKTLSERIGHADVTVTGRIYTHKSRGTDRAMAQAMGELIELATTGKSRETEELGTDLGTDRRNPGDEQSDQPRLAAP
jgi:integrase